MLTGRVLNKAATGTRENVRLVRHCYAHTPRQFQDASPVPNKEAEVFGRLTRPFPALRTCRAYQA